MNHMDKFLNNKSYFKPLVALLILITAAFLGAKIVSEVGGKEKTETMIPSINVSGEGEVLAKPDIAAVSVSARKENTNLKVAQNNATDAINKVVAFLGEEKIQEKDIKTSAYNIYPREEVICLKGNVFPCPPRSRKTERTYVVSQTIEIKIRDLEKIGDILSGVASRGADEVSALVFKIENEDALREEARAEAIKQAQEKAKTLAAQLGVRLRRLLNYSEYGPSPIPIYKGYGAEMMAPAAAPSPAVPVGENAIKVSVNLSYEIK